VEAQAIGQTLDISQKVAEAERALCIDEQRPVALPHGSLAQPAGDHRFSAV
jgi:hypothetical protein